MVEPVRADNDARAAAITDVPVPPLTERQMTSMSTPKSRREEVVGGGCEERSGGQADWSFLTAAATSATRATSMMRRFMAGRIALVRASTTLQSGGVRVPGGLRRLQSGWDERPSSGGFDSRPPPPNVS